MLEKKFQSLCVTKINKPGTAQVGAISKAQQILWNIRAKIDNVIREMKILYPNFQKVISEL